MHRRHQHLNIPIEIVRTVVAISETGSLSKAGDRLHVPVRSIRKAIFFTWSSWLRASTLKIMRAKHAATSSAWRVIARVARMKVS